ncbi:BLUF domain-containing protein [Flavobacteriaceae bacterium KMM 6898]|nr:BLUF domain-containing protein [Flavobacteriaceae bacterium KMM 6898]
MYELVYSSKAKNDTDSIKIFEILKTSRTNNLIFGITGCLVFHNNVFVQIIEGDSKYIQNLYQNIEKDERHHQVKLLWEGFIPKRNFNDWSMAYHDLGEGLIKDNDILTFERNLFQLSESADKTSPASYLFWLNVRKQIIGWLV